MELDLPGSQQTHISVINTARNAPTRLVVAGGYFDDLPVEIMGEIFRHCLPFESERMPTPQMYEAPLLLCRICIRWRRVAMSMPILWSSFSVQPSRASNAPPYLPLMKFFLSLSRPCPLSFALCPSTLEQQALVKRSFPLFLSEVHRWHDVTLELDETLCEQFLAAPLGCDSSLEALYFPIFKGTKKQAQQIPAALNNFPRLRRLNIGQRLTAPLLELPWSQLTDIDLNTPLPLDECIDALNQSLNMVNCNLYRITVPNSAVRPHNIRLPALTSLFLGSSCDVGEILARVTCPALTHLSINHDVWDTTRDLKAFGEFFVRSSCELETFRLLDEKVTECDVLHYLSTPALQTLKSLEFRGLGASVETLTMFLYVGDTAPALMPLLERLELDVEGVPDNLFCDVVASRFSTIATTDTALGKRAVSLKYVDAWFRRRNHDSSPSDKRALREEHISDLRRFQEFRSRGLCAVTRVGY